MTATQSPLSPSSSSDRRADPSMEEILASIRKIIAEDDQPASRPAPAIPIPPRREVEESRLAAVVTPITPNVVPARPASPLFGSLRSTQVSASPAVEPYVRDAAPAEPAKPVSEAAPRVESEGVASAAPEPVSSEPQAVEPSAGHPAPQDFIVRHSRPQPSSSDAGALVSAATTESIASAFQALTTSVALTNSETIDRHVRELLRPMLRTWLDDNLPVIVEKLVRSEIERVARGGR